MDSQFKLKVWAGLALFSLLASDLALAKDKKDAPPAAPGQALTFAFVGCNRLPDADAKTVGSASTANVAQLKQTLADIAALKPQYLFLAGDVVAGLKPGTTELDQQLTDWKALVKQAANIKDIKHFDPVQDAAKGISGLVVLTGNHEMLYKQSTKGDAASAAAATPTLVDDEDDTPGQTEFPNQAAYGYWQDKMAHYIANTNGPGSGGKDMLQNDEKGLSYSFTVGANLFVILNTDAQSQPNNPAVTPPANGKTIGYIPLHWIKKTIQDAQADPKVANIFVMGHKPLIASKPKTATTGASASASASASSSASAASGADKIKVPGEKSILPDQAKKLFDLLNANSKVRAYLAAHAHEWDFNKKMKKLGEDGHVPQIIAGNGGSPPKKSVWKDGYFGFTLVTISDKGQITAQSYGRPICPQGDSWNAASATCTDPSKDQASCTPQVGIWDASNKVCTIPYYQQAKVPAAVVKDGPYTLK
jgi:hypothetical protein